MFKFIVLWFLTILVIASNQAIESASVHDNPLCPLCLETLNKTVSYLKQNKTKDEILHTIELGICLGLGPLALPCYEFVKKNGPKIIDELANNTDPLAVCEGIKLCDGNSTLKIRPKKEAIKVSHSEYIRKVGNSTFCPLCEAFVNEIGTMLKENKTKEEVLHTLELICLPLGGLALPCYELVKKEGLRLIDLVANNTNATVVCQGIKLCDSFVAKIFNPISESCPACLIIFTLKNDYAISLIIQSLCSNSNNKSYCYQFFKHNDPRFICENIGICQNN